ncbi:nicotinate-nucleotide--dimethylbenzimidazole phosphoribosyltransferase [Kordiimonas aquimaris]|uniref:nicotinate-nucleotide--dimethylbenzimidazole phosphoribosyltransferase n=1 Tax=Kordiimonas aquimaris TaxID=707591 RepID=UPI0021D35D57|nr:nicotinate-nucleotide--dimethylbenzimidazole phosphoribosyltransferase [Kordiimonas aquimaris]
MTSPNPLNDLRNLFLKVSSIDAADVRDEAVANKQPSATAKNVGFDQLIWWLKRWQADETADISEAHLCVLASSYVGASGSQEVFDFIEAASKGSASVNKLCKQHGVGLRVLEMAPAIPHDTEKPWSEAECMAATAFGMEAIAAGGQLLGLSAIAPGNIKASISLIEEVKRNKYASSSEEAKKSYDALDIMRKLGGREIAGLVGAILAAKSKPMPVLTEGWSAIAAMHIAHAIDPTSIDHVQVASVSDEKQREYVLEINKVPIIGQYVDFGAGCGLALAVSSIVSLLYLAK